MRKILFGVIFCFIPLSFLQVQRPAGEEERVMQTFAVFSGEKKIASDFVIRVRWLQGVDLITFTDGLKVLRMDVIYEDGQFRLFKLARDNKEEMTVRARRDSFLVSHAVKGTSSFPRKGDEVVLDANGWGQFAFLIYRYSAAKGGQQMFRAFVPSQQKVVSVAVERHGSDRFQCGEIVLEAIRYRIIQEGKDLYHLWSTKDGKIVGIHHPAKGICVVDEEYEDLHNNIRSLAYGKQ